MTAVDRFVVGWLLVAIVMFGVLWFFPAPYGRYTGRRWGPVLGGRLGWLTMEAAAPITFAACFVLGKGWQTPIGLILLLMWETHYIDRAFVYPFRIRTHAREMPVAVVCFGMLFNVVNGYLNGRSVYLAQGHYPNMWITDLRFICGVAVFFLGFVINRQADAALRALRQPGEAEYKIPHGGLFRWISCPNYLGELIIWSGWALATWSMPGLAFAVWTGANLVPRARSHHRWYKERFSDYPGERRALLPGLW